jgi:hypothetical protein
VGAGSITNTLVYTYNGDGVRVAMAVDGETTRYTWDLAAGLPDLLSDGETRYTAGAGQYRNGEWTYALADGLGSVRQLADEKGYVVQRYDYSPFGQVIAAEGERVRCSTPASSGTETWVCSTCEPGGTMVILTDSSVPTPLYPISRNRRTSTGTYIVSMILSTASIDQGFREGQPSRLRQEVVAIPWRGSSGTGTKRDGLMSRRTGNSGVHMEKA